ncbi:MAG: 4Fe-4S dicluster domain-containing protein [Candidatus Helarchaeota archaeon]|nr:4Fe-4S dicluster domain-containing protein [Candidatus Helarchaeota archaeon]
MVKRKIIKIDDNLCIGCGDCIPSCPEQALQIVDTPEGKKARIVKDLYCDGLGACLGACPTGALTIEEKETEPYDDDATIERIKKVAPEMLETHIKHMEEHATEMTEQHTHHEIHPGIHTCPSAKVLDWTKDKTTTEPTTRIDSELRQWPVQLHLVPPSAPYFQNADLAIVADCVPFAYANFHQDFLKDHAIAIGCPKLDNANAYIDKIAQIIKIANLKSIKIVHMEVPCCFGLVQIVHQAMKKAGKSIPFEEVTISIRGEKI